MTSSKQPSLSSFYKPDGKRVLCDPNDRFLCESRATPTKASSKQQCICNVDGRAVASTPDEAIPTTTKDIKKHEREVKKLKTAAAATERTQRQLQERVLEVLLESHRIEDVPVGLQKIILYIQRLMFSQESIEGDALSFNYVQSIKDCKGRWNPEKRRWCAPSVAVMIDLIRSTPWRPLGLGDGSSDRMLFAACEVVAPRGVSKSETNQSSSETNVSQPKHDMGLRSGTLQAAYSSAVCDIPLDTDGIVPFDGSLHKELPAWMPPLRLKEGDCWIAKARELGVWWPETSSRLFDFLSQLGPSESLCPSLRLCRGISLDIVSVNMVNHFTARLYRTDASPVDEGALLQTIHATVQQYAKTQVFRWKDRARAYFSKKYPGVTMLGL